MPKSESIKLTLSSQKTDFVKYQNQGKFGVLGKICDGIHDYESYGRECCSREEPCEINQGDCDKEYECQGNLICGTNNCPWPFPRRADCCVNPWILNLLILFLLWCYVYCYFLDTIAC